MSFLLFLLLFFFLFKFVGGLIVNFLLNSRFSQKRNGRKTQFNNDFYKIFQEMLNNLNQQQQSRAYSNDNQQQNRTINNNKMSRNEAFEVLGLSKTATNTEIKEAYRKLMMKNHPDCGGSNYLSQKITEAKNLLLNE